jgi:hypothetical protein
MLREIVFKSRHQDFDPSTPRRQKHDALQSRHDLAIRSIDRLFERDSRR